MKSLSDRRAVTDQDTSHIRLEVECDMADWLVLHLLEISDRTGLTLEQVAVVALVHYLSEH